PGRQGARGDGEPARGPGLVPPPREWLDVVLSPDGRYLLALSAGARPGVWGTDTARAPGPPPRVAGGPRPPPGVAPGRRRRRRPLLSTGESRPEANPAGVAGPLGDIGRRTALTLSVDPQVAGPQDFTFSPAGDRILARDSRGRVLVWDAATGRALSSFVPGTG